MKKYFLLKELTLLGLVVLLVIGNFPGCNGTAPLEPDHSGNNYYFAGTLINNLSLDNFVMVADLKRNDTTLADANVIVSDDTLIYNGSYYISTIDSSDHLNSGIKSYIINDSDLYGDTLTVVLPSDISITSVLPPVKGPTEFVNVQWTGSAGADGYIIAVVKQDSSYLKMGYSQFVTSQSTYATIENEAFTKNSLSGGEPNPGIYNIYVYAYWGVSDSIITSTLLPVPLPVQLDNNINEIDLSGSIGAIVVSRPGSVEVVAE